MKSSNVLFSALQLVVVALSLCLIFVPAWRPTPLRLVVLALYAVVAARDLLRWYRAGYLGSVPREIGSEIARGGVRASSFGVLSSVVGAIAIALSL